MSTLIEAPAIATAERPCGRTAAATMPGYFRLDCRRAQSADVVAPRLRLVLYGFAGGTITALLSLAKAFPAWVEVWGAEYPGRGLRWQTSLLARLDRVLDDLQPGLAQLSDCPVAMLGFSMGAHVAYRLALRTAASPLGLVAISGRPPRWGSTEWAEEKLSDAELIERLRALGGMPPEILESRVMMDSFMPVVRADLELCADMNRFAPRSLPCPLLVLEGTHDRLLIDADVPRWLDVAGGLAGQSRHRAYPGGHFFHKGKEGEVAHDIASWLDALLAAAPPDALATSVTQPGSPLSTVP